MMFMHHSCDWVFSAYMQRGVFGSSKIKIEWTKSNPFKKSRDDTYQPTNTKRPLKVPIRNTI